MEIKEGKVYIFRGNRHANRHDFTKFKIIEITKDSYFINNMDADTKFRRGIEDFHFDYIAVEEIITK